MKGHFHAPDLDHDFFPGFVCGTGSDGESRCPETAHGDHINLWFGNFADGWFAIDRIMFVRLLVMVLMGLFFFFAMRKPKLVPRGVQNVAEYLLDFVRIHISEEILGRKEGRRFLPIISTIFFLVLFMNAPSVIPFLNVSPNARIGMPLLLAVVAYICMIYAGAKRYGFGKYMKSSLVIPGLPFLLYFLVVPIEFVRAGLVRQAAYRWGMRQIDPHIAFLTGDTPPAGVLACEVLDAVPLSKLTSTMAKRAPEQIEILVRGVAANPDHVRAKIMSAVRKHSGKKTRNQRKNEASAHRLSQAEATADSPSSGVSGGSYTIVITQVGDRQGKNSSVAFICGPREVH